MFASQRNGVTDMEMYRFEIGSLIVRAVIEPDHDVDLSWDESGETAEKLESGEWEAFGTIVTVERNGHVIGEDSLWGSIYADPAEFFTAHRDPDPANRNCSLNGTAIGHYFPDMVRSAIADARRTLGETE